MRAARTQAWLSPSIVTSPGLMHEKTLLFGALAATALAAGFGVYKARAAPPSLAITPVSKLDSAHVLRSAEVPVRPDWSGIGATSGAAVLVVLLTTAASLPLLWRLTGPGGLRSE